MHGNQRLHSFLSKTEVQFFCSANVTGAVIFLAQTRHGITHVAPARAEADVAVKALVTLARVQGETCGRKWMSGSKPTMSTNSWLWVKLSALFFKNDSCSKTLGFESVRKINHSQSRSVMTREGENWRRFVKTVMALSLMNLLKK